MIIRQQIVPKSCGQKSNNKGARNLARSAGAKPPVPHSYYQECPSQEIAKSRGQILARKASGGLDVTGKSSYLSLTAAFWQTAPWCLIIQVCACTGKRPSSDIHLRIGIPGKMPLAISTRIISVVSFLHWCEYVRQLPCFWCFVVWQSIKVFRIWYYLIWALLLNNEELICIIIQSILKMTWMMYAFSTVCLFWVLLFSITSRKVIGVLLNR